MQPAKEMHEIASKAKKQNNERNRIALDMFSKMMGEMVANELEERIEKASKEGKCLLWLQHGLGSTLESGGWKGLSEEICNMANIPIKHGVMRNRIFLDSIKNTLDTLTRLGYTLECEEYSPHKASYPQLPVTPENVVQHSLKIRW